MEFVLIIVIIAIVLQVCFLRDSWQKINRLKNVFQDGQKFKAEEFFIPSKEFNTTTYERMLASQKFYKNSNYETDEEESSTSFAVRLRGEKESINLIRIPSDSETAATIESSINNYLIRNKGVASDFTIIKDIVERNCSMIEDEVDTQTPFPLYIGLMCTMIGIICGIWSISWIQATGPNGLSGFAAFVAAPEKHIGTLMQDVAWAMVASFCGIGITSIISFLAKGAKKVVETRKNAFYSWFQAELMPIISRENASQGMQRLEKNLTQFNTTFSRNVMSMSKSVSRISDTAAEQSKLLEVVDKLDLKKMATANVKVLTAFKESTGQLEEFNGFITYANTQLKELEKRNNAVSEAVNSVDDGVNRALTQLKKSVDDQMQALRESLQQSADQMDKLVNTQKRLVEGQAGKVDAFYQTLQSLQPVVNGLQDWRKELQAQHKELSRLVQAVNSMPRPDGQGGGTVVVRNSANIWQMVIAIALVLLLGLNAFMVWHSLSNEKKVETTEATTDSIAVTPAIPTPEATRATDGAATAEKWDSVTDKHSPK